MNRWQELKSNPKLRENLVERDLIIRAVREWFYREEFVEVETPRIVKHPGMEPYLNPLSTTLYDERGMAHQAYLITSPEYSMKKLLASGLDKIFDIGKVFRNGEPCGGAHNPEFTMIEWYRARSDYRELMTDTENMIISVITGFRKKSSADLGISNSDPTGHHPQGDKFLISNQIPNQNFLKYQGRRIDISLPWERLSVKQAFKNFCDLNLDELLDLPSIKKAAESRGYKIEQDFRYEDVFFKIFLNEIEPHLGKDRPVFLYDYPLQLAALARAKSPQPPLRKGEPSRQSSGYTERVELYIGGLEIANGFSELVDTDEQERRLREEQKLRKELGKEVYEIDQDFLAALKAMPESAGIALGVDRLVMLLLDARSIDEVLSFSCRRIFYE